MTLTSKEYFLKNVKINDKIEYVNSKNDYFTQICYITEIKESDRSVNILTSLLDFFVDFENKQIHGIDKETNLSYEVTHIRGLNVSSFFLDENNLSDNNKIKDKKEITMSDLCSIVRTGHTIEYINKLFFSQDKFIALDKVKDLERDDNSFIIIGNNTTFTIDFNENKIYSDFNSNLKLIKVGDLDLSKLFENNPQPNEKIETPNLIGVKSIKNDYKKSALINNHVIECVNHDPIIESEVIDKNKQNIQNLLNEFKDVFNMTDNFKGIAIDPQETGSKFDNDKNRIGLLFTDFAIALKEIAKVATFGAKKYSDHNWRLVDNKKKRYQDALSRHILDYFEDNNSLDDESKLLNLAHAGWNILSLLVIQLTEGKK